MPKEPQTSESFINQAIDLGSRLGLDALDPLQRMVFLISEAEVLCDMEGIDSFLSSYPTVQAECADAFKAVGAVEIAAGLRKISSGKADDAVLAKVNGLITKRTGYNYESICQAVERLKREKQ